MTALDFALAALLAYSVYSGYRSGLITGIFSFIGLVGGGLLGLSPVHIFLVAGFKAALR